MLTAEQIIALLDLRPLSMEGGFFRETYRSGLMLHRSGLPDVYARDKATSTAMYYFLTPETFSALHRLPTDEVFHFYLGDPVEMLQLYPDGSSKVVVLGTDLILGQRPQVLAPAGVWQGSRLVPGGAWALLGTTVAPAFDFSDFESGDRSHLLKAYPHEAERIQGLTAE